MENVLNQVLEAQAEERLGAGRYERCEARTGYRTRQLYSRVGPLTLQVPPFRDDSFSTEIFQRYQRSEQARVRAWSERSLGCFPFLLLDALYVKVREDERIVTQAALVVSGINAEGYREVLGLKRIFRAETAAEAREKAHGLLAEIHEAWQGWRYLE